MTTIRTGPAVEKVAIAVNLTGLYVIGRRTITAHVLELEILDMSLAMRAGGRVGQLAGRTVLKRPEITIKSFRSPLPFQPKANQLLYLALSFFPSP